MKKLIVNISDDKHKELKTLAFLEDTTMTDIVLELVYKHLEQSKQKSK